MKIVMDAKSERLAEIQTRASQAGEELAERARKMNADLRSGYEKVTDKKVKALFEERWPWLKEKK